MQNSLTNCFAGLAWPPQMTTTDCQGEGKKDNSQIKSLILMNPSHSGLYLTTKGLLYILILKSMLK